MDKDIQREIRKIIDRIEKKSADGDYIYRGEPKTHEGPPYHGKVSSNLWREYGLEVEGFDMQVIEKEILDDAKKHIGDLPQDSRGGLAASLNVIREDIDETTDFEILTEIQHYSGKTNLIDFTIDYFIALFFACDGHHNKKGRVILQKTEEIRDIIKHPRSPRHRVIAQKSVFVRPPKGFIEPHEDDIVTIPGDIKRWMLQNLRKYHGISTETIYNDLYGFIRHQDIHGGAYTHFYRGFAYQKRGDEATISKEKQKWYKETLKHYTRAIQLDPNQVSAYNNRGITHRNLGDYNSAIDDYNRVIMLNPNDAEAYSNRGLAYQDKGDYKEAIADYTQAIQLTPDLAQAYYNRGVFYQDKGDYKKAIADYTQAIQLKPDLGQAYSNRGEVLLHLREWEKAEADLIAAKEMGMDIIASFRNDYKSVEDFKDRNGFELPENIAEILTPTQS